MNKKNRGTPLFAVIIVFIALNAACFAVMPFYVRSLFLTQLHMNAPGLMLGIILYAYLMSAPYFTALAMCARLARNISNDTVFSRSSIKALTTLSVCSVVECALCALGSLLYALIIGGKYAIILLFLAVVCCAAVILAGIFSRVINNAIKLKEENELTI